MRAVAIYPKSGKLDVIETPTPSIKSPHDVLVKTLSVGLCGTDHEIAAQDYGRAPDDGDYLILGHECLGEVLEVGAAVNRFSPGQLVVPSVRRPCDSESCAACRSGRPDFCLTGDFTERGISGAHGFMCEQFVESEQYLHPVPDEMRDFGVLTEPLTIAMKALIQIRDIQDRLPYMKTANFKNGILEGLTAVVLGAGPVGLLGALALLNSGARVFVYSRKEEPNENSKIIENAGGEYVSSSTVSAEQFAELTGNVDVIYEATGASSFAFKMTKLLGRNSIYILTGVPGRKGPVEIDADRIMRDMVLKNQLIVGTVNAGAPAYEAAINTLGDIHKRWPASIDGIITDVLKPEDVGQALKTRSSGIKQVVQFT